MELKFGASSVTTGATKRINANTSAITIGTRHHDDWLDAMRYCYDDILTTMYYSTFYKKHAHGIEKVIFHDPATIVYWVDGDKTVVKCSKDDIFDPEKGLAMAISKKFLGDSFKQAFKVFVPEEEKEKANKSHLSNMRTYMLIDAIKKLNNLTTLNKKD